MKVRTTMVYGLESPAFKTIARAIANNSDCVNLSVIESAYEQGMIQRDILTGDASITSEDLQTIADAYSDVGDIRAIA